MSQKSKAMSRPPAITADKFDTNKFSVTLTQESVQKQDAAKKPKMPYYTSPKLEYNIKTIEDGKEVTKKVYAQPVVMTGDIKLIAYGIPTNPKGEGVEPFYKNEKERSFFKIPLDPSQPACAEIIKMIDSLDEYMVDKDNLKTIMDGLKERIPSCEYSPLHKEASEKMKEPKFGFLKVHLDTDYESGNIMTQIYVKQPNGKNEQQQITTLKDVEKYFRWGCTFRCALMINKMWMMKGKNTSKKYPYGLGIKCMQIIIKEPGAGGNSTKEAYRKFMFDDEGDADAIDEEDTEKKQPESSDKKQSSKKKQEEPDEDTEDEPRVSKKHDESEDENKSDDDSDDEKPIGTKKKQTDTDEESDGDKKKQSPKKKQSDSEDDSDEEKPKNVKKKKVVSDDDDDDDDFDDTKASKSKKPIKIVKKKQVSYSDDEDDDD